MMDLLTLTEIRRAASRTGGSAVPARVHVQVEGATPKLTREQQPYCELTLADACDRMTLRVWSDHPAYKTCSALTNQDFIELTAEFYQSQYGLDARQAGGRLGIHHGNHPENSRPAPARIVRSVRERMGRPVSSHRGSAQLSSR